jgi:hypothetical protein
LRAGPALPNAAQTSFSVGGEAITQTHTSLLSKPALRNGTPLGGPTQAGEPTVCRGAA